MNSASARKNKQAAQHYLLRVSVEGNNEDYFRRIMQTNSTSSELVPNDLAQCYSTYTCTCKLNAGTGR